MTTKNPFKKAIFIGAALLAVGLVTSVSPVFAEQPEVNDHLTDVFTALLEDPSTHKPDPSTHKPSCTVTTNNGCNCKGEKSCKRNRVGSDAECESGGYKMICKDDQKQGCQCETIIVPVTTK